MGSDRSLGLPSQATAAHHGHAVALLAPAPTSKPDWCRFSWVVMAAVLALMGAGMCAKDWMVNQRPAAALGLGAPSSPAPAAAAAANPPAWQAVPRGQANSEVAVCISVKDEHCDIREWILYHTSIGVGKFYIFDTESNPPMQSVLDDMIASGLVEYRYVNKSSSDLHFEEPRPGMSVNWQVPIYSACLDWYGARHKWMAFFDNDEFIALRGGIRTLPQLLEGYADRGALVLHWTMFSNDGHIERPRGGLLASYTACCGREDISAHYFKSIVQPRYTPAALSPHQFAYNSSKYAVNTLGERVEHMRNHATTEPNYEKAAIHHYTTKSLADFHAKEKRRGGSGGARDVGWFLRYIRQCKSTCTDLVAAGQRLRQQYDLNRHVPLKECLHYAKEQRECSLRPK